MAKSYCREGGRSDSNSLAQHCKRPVAAAAPLGPESNTTSEGGVAVAVVEPSMTATATCK
eukprot:2447709-Amphidinium_carterae.1